MKASMKNNYCPPGSSRI